MRPGEPDYDASRAARVFGVTATGLSAEPSRSATLAALRARGRAGVTVLDLDYRPMFWPSRQAARDAVAPALGLVTVAVGNLDECDMAVGAGETPRGWGVTPRPRARVAGGVQRPPGAEEENGRMG